MDIWAPHYKAREFKPTTFERGPATTSTYREHATYTNRIPMNETYNMTPNETRYETNTRNAKFTPKRYTSQNRHESIETPNNNTSTESNITQGRNIYSTNRRETGRRQDNRQLEQQQQKYQQNSTQQMNTRANFLDNKQTQQFHQGARNIYRQGVNNQYR